MVPDQLLNAYMNSGYILYPTRFPETGCISLIKAMASGCIPITSRYFNSVLGNGFGNHSAQTDRTPDPTPDRTPSSNRVVDMLEQEQFTDMEDNKGLTYLYDLGPAIGYEDPKEALLEAERAEHFNSWVRDVWVPSVLTVVKHNMDHFQRCVNQDHSGAEDPPSRQPLDQNSRNTAFVSHAFRRREMSLYTRREYTWLNSAKVLAAIVDPPP